MSEDITLENSSPVTNDEMVDRYIAPIKNIHPGIIQAFRNVDRKDFMQLGFEQYSYEDRPVGLNTGSGVEATVSQPYTVAEFLKALELQEGERVLEIGTGSGYNAALMADLVGKTGEVYTIEIDQRLAAEADMRLLKRGLDNVHVVIGDGAKGLPQHAPFDAIIITAAVKDFPEALIDQLTEGGRILGPLGYSNTSTLMVLGIKRGNKLQTTIPSNLSYRFVPLLSSEYGGWNKEESELERNREIQFRLLRSIDPILDQVISNPALTVEQITEMLRERTKHIGEISDEKLKDTAETIIGIAELKRRMNEL
jgi:protein-L-isoaspartate(D-aspartate) O-methyltransferase